MSFCPRCGAATTPAMSFCTACGENLPAVPVAPTAPGIAPTPAALPGRPIGKRVTPVLVPILGVITVGLYTLYFWWRTTREMDAYAGSRAHAPARIGVLITLVGMALTLVITLAVFGSLDLEAIANDPANAPTSAELQEDMQGHPLYPWSLALTLAGAGVLYVGLWRMWSALRDDELRRGRAQAFDPRLAVAILAAGAIMSVVTPFVTSQALATALSLVGLVIFVATLVVLYQTQARLNETWQAAGAGASFSVPG